MKRISELPSGYQSIEALEDRLQSQTEAYWIDRGQKRVLQLFHHMGERVPANKITLNKQGMNA